MKDTEYKVLTSVADMINNKFQELHKTGAFDEIIQAINTALQQVSPDYSASLDVQFNVTNTQNENTLHLLTTGISCSAGINAYVHCGDSTPGKYLVAGDIRIVPHDYCPSCWGVWNFKFKHRTCLGCGSELGKQVKVMLDNDVCPWCEQGKINLNQPKCDHCGFVIDPSWVVWG